MPLNGTPADPGPDMEPEATITGINMSVGHMPGRRERVLMIGISLQLALPLTGDAAADMAQKLTGGIQITTQMPPGL